jgi:hypothetical protein
MTRINCEAYCKNSIDGVCSCAELILTPQADGLDCDEFSGIAEEETEDEEELEPWEDEYNKEDDEFNRDREDGGIADEEDEFGRPL